MRGKEEAKTEWISLCKRTYVCVRSSSSDELQANENENNNKLFLLPLPLYLHYLTNRQTDSRLVEKKRRKFEGRGKRERKKGRIGKCRLHKTTLKQEGLLLLLYIVNVFYVTQGSVSRHVDLNERMSERVKFRDVFFSFHLLFFFSCFFCCPEIRLCR